MTGLVLRLASETRLPLPQSQIVRLHCDCWPNLWMKCPHSPWQRSYCQESQLLWRVRNASEWMMLKSEVVKVVIVVMVAEFELGPCVWRDQSGLTFRRRLLH
jgi:hypothetical protein